MTPRQNRQQAVIKRWPTLSDCPTDCNYACFALRVAWHSYHSL